METRKVHVDQLHAQISQDGYRVDPHAIADAILKRLAAGRTLAGGAGTSR